MPAPQDIVDASEHYHGEQTNDVIPSLLTVIVDTNPRAWAALNNVLPLSKAVGNILPFVNAHLAADNANQVAILAAHSRAVWLYPTPPKPPAAATTTTTTTTNGSSTTTATTHPSANKFPKFAEIERSVLGALRDLVGETTADKVAATTTTAISGALALALSHINKVSLSLTATRGAISSSTTTSSSSSTSAPSGPAPSSSSANPQSSSSGGGLAGLHARILVVSVSDSSPAQYIPVMNSMFAAAQAHIPIDVLCLRGSPTFLQQASFLTRGIFIRAAEPQGILQYLMFGMARCPPSSLVTGGGGGADKGGLDGGKGGDAKKSGKAGGLGIGGSGGGGGGGGNMLAGPNAEVVDFRAACFCHRRVVDMGYICNVCLSIFCEVPDGGECLTCGMKLKVGNYGGGAAAPRPVVA